MIGDSDNVYAVIVSAETFELVDDGGEVVALFGAAPNISPGSWDTWSLRFRHHDSILDDSLLRWSVANPRGSAEAQESIALSGPQTGTDTDDGPALILQTATGPTIRRAQLGTSRAIVNNANPGIRFDDFGNTSARIDANQVNLCPADRLALNGRTAYVLTYSGWLHLGGATTYALPLGSWGLVPFTSRVINVGIGDIVTITSSVDGRLVSASSRANAIIQYCAAINGSRLMPYGPYFWWPASTPGTSGVTIPGVFQWVSNVSGNVTVALYGTCAGVVAGEARIDENTAMRITVESKT